MTMDKTTILNKIKKCLALSQSANENEAAQALKHAQKLMEMHGIHESAVELSEVSEHDVAAANSTLPRWHWMIIHVVTKAFACQCIHRKRGRGKSSITFIGLAERPELAKYAYEVLLRQVKLCRKQYLKADLAYIDNAYLKNKHANKFCEGWAMGVNQKVTEFAQTDKEVKIMTKYMQTLSVRYVKQRQKKSVSDDLVASMRAGVNAGLQANLYRGMGAENEPLKLT